MKKFQVVTTTEGCATNLLENSLYRSELKQNGWEAVQKEEADVIIVNTCGHTQEREDYTVKTLKELKKKFPDKKIVVGGCLANISPAKLDELDSGKTFSPGNVDQLWWALDSNPLDEHSRKENEVNAANFFDAQDFEKLTFLHKIILGIRPLFRFIEKKIGGRVQPLHNLFETVIVNEEFFGITVGQGCAGKCTFCAIKTAKGHIKSKPITKIKQEMESGIQKGYEKFWFLGDDIGCYGVDKGETIVDLLREVLSLDSSFKLVINYLEPMFLVKHYDELKNYLADPRIININIPIQSGSDRIITQMGRDYRARNVIECLKDLKKRNPNVIIKNNIIVGFPGEKLSDLMRSIYVCFFFDANLAIPFASRPGTRAAKMTNQISSLKKTFRFYIINFFIILRHAYVFMSWLLKSRIERGNVE